MWRKFAYEIAIGFLDCAMQATKIAAGILLAVMLIVLGGK